MKHGIGMDKQKKFLPVIKKAIYNFCFNRCHSTFLAKDIARLTDISATALGRNYLPILIDEDLIRVFNNTTHTARRYLVIRENWKSIGLDVKGV